MGMAGFASPVSQARASAKIVLRRVFQCHRCGMAVFWGVGSNEPLYGRRPTLFDFWTSPARYHVCSAVWGEW